MHSVMRLAIWRVNEDGGEANNNPYPNTSVAKRAGYEGQNYYKRMEACRSATKAFRVAPSTRSVLGRRPGRRPPRGLLSPVNELQSTRRGRSTGRTVTFSLSPKCLPRCIRPVRRRTQRRAQGPLRCPNRFSRVEAAGGAIGEHRRGAHTTRAIERPRRGRVEA